MPRDACAELFGIPENPVPEGAVVEVLTAEDGVRLRAARFAPPAGQPKGTICLFQGRAETIEKYFETIEDLRARGFVVAALDWRGQGGSARLTRDPLKGHIPHFSHYQRDIKVFMERFVLPECPAPIFGLAHSMGGPIALIAAQRHFTWFERLVLLAPLFGLPGLQMGRTARSIARTVTLLGLGSFFMPFGNRKRILQRVFEGNLLTSDQRRFLRTAAVLTAHPHLRISGPTNGWIHSAFGAMDIISARQFPASLRTPVLILTAAYEGIVSNAAITRVARRLRTARVISIDGARHEMLMERDAIREGVLAAVDAFIPGTDPFAEADSRHHHDAL
ncbi:lysophospholipase [Agaricicola taiwanensis]|uniref:Lysophospholipase n=1 Tax=Agaricicola taiwanensis TaxID=591372 RepID=A0A8J2VUJ9_9RHOB|nr:alpha/beta hydrolase [Agaricicola taiwanensis]GGE38560.1 lysophospholipase [Agaricicola taiwanensis]